MALSSPTQASRKTVVVVDVLFVAWFALWLVVGVLVARNVSDLEQLPDTLEASVAALEQTAEGLRQFEGLPFVGDRVGAVANEVEETAAETAESAQVTRESIDELAVLLSLAIIVIPAVPAAAAYLPWRIARFREVRSLRRALERADRERVYEHLAHRALVTLPFHQLLQITPSPWRDVHEGRYERLAAAELARLGIRPPDLPDVDRPLVDSRSPGSNN